MKCQYCGTDGAEEVFGPGTYLCRECLNRAEPEEAIYREAEEMGLTGQAKRDHVQEELDDMD